MRTEGDARLVALSAQRDLGTEGTQGRGRNQLDDGLDGSVPPEGSTR